MKLGVVELGGEHGEKKCLICLEANAKPESIQMVRLCLDMGLMMDQRYKGDSHRRLAVERRLQSTDSSAAHSGVSLMA